MYHLGHCPGCRSKKYGDLIDCDKSAGHCPCCDCWNLKVSTPETYQPGCCAGCTSKGRVHSRKGMLAVEHCNPCTCKERPPIFNAPRTGCCSWCKSGPFVRHKQKGKNGHCEGCRCKDAVASNIRFPEARKRNDRWKGKF